MGMSGGIDSSYLLYVMKEKYGLRPLVFHVDSGWNSNVACSNIEKLIEERNNARKEKDFKLSDKIRDDLIKKGIELKDNPDSTTNWYVKI